MSEAIGVITGGTGALGEAVVGRLAPTMGSLWVPWTADTAAERLRLGLGQAARRVTLRRADLTVEPDVRQLFDEIAATHGRLDFLINLAGGFSSGPLESLDARTWRNMIELNATTAFLSCRYAVPLMKRAGRGRIVNVASGPAVNHGAPNMSPYSAAKAAVLSLTESLAKELAPSGITVNALVPTVIDTPANRAAMPKADRSSWLQPQEIAQVVEFLLSEAAQIVTGSAVCLSKG